MVQSGYETRIERLIAEFVDRRHEEKGTETTWREPVVGFADAHDPLFAELKRIVGDNHALPEDIVTGARSVIAYFVPFEEGIAKGNIHGEESSRGWDIAYIETNALITDLNLYLHDWIEAQGFTASNLPPTYNFDRVTLKSDWSHRSVACIAGIGTFGVNHMLITPQGCCGRVGSVITDLPLHPTPRPDEEYCLYLRDGSCGACIKRCVNDAFSIGQDGMVIFDRFKCNEQIYDKVIIEYEDGIGDTCGKCMCGVPCSFKIPRA